MILQDTVKGFIGGVVLVGAMLAIITAPYVGPLMFVRKPLEHSERKAMAMAVKAWFSSVNNAYIHYQKDFLSTPTFQAMTQQMLNELEAEIQTHHHFKNNIVRIDTDFKIAPSATKTHAFVQGMNYFYMIDSKGRETRQGTGGAYEFTFRKENDGKYTVLKVNHTDCCDGAFYGLKTLETRPNFFDQNVITPKEGVVQEY